MPSFLVESYKVRLGILRKGSPPAVTQRDRVLEILSVPTGLGVVYRAILVFSTAYDNWSVNTFSGAPIVAYYDTTNPLDPRVSGWLPSTEYSFWYDVLRSEKPLTFFYTITVIKGVDYVSEITLGSSTEPIGEGPKDVSP